MNIQDTEIVELVSQIEEAEQKLLAHPMHKVFATFNIPLASRFYSEFKEVLRNHTKVLTNLLSRVFWVAV